MHFMSVLSDSCALFIWYLISKGQFTVKDLVSCSALMDVVDPLCTGFVLYGSSPCQVYLVCLLHDFEHSKTSNRPPADRGSVAGAFQMQYMFVLSISISVTHAELDLY